ncbi:MAG: inositol monophosphatase [Thermoplasmata archaeon]|uniref:fructose-bisphosphatase n=1 Tax=Candidatus Sysuiplasma superficiale TaxID=2823368 RepID=A0A8J7YVP3_9ARCH|nr:inositol monophosphatase [Candidatus Sysuiplasma superficiale]MBX8643251.1 inositol monophosphatase [Candidatus Sysuiplasma superficiale]MCL4346979.1 inositol monophosphatase [Candidatus Thermoplasmatota archaeon]MCL5437480.1 inositol monophosphatase [Candidatus Thermoplasmatota archaeon]
MKKELTEIASSVREAVASISGSPKAGEVVGKGVDGAPSYNADAVAEQAAKRKIDELGLGLNILSEESPYVDNKSGQTIVLDPLDGSHNLIRGIPFYSVSIAIGSRSLSGVQYGLVMNLVTGDTFYAEKGKGAFRNDELIHVKKFSEKDSLFFVYMGANASNNAYDISRKSGMVRSLGSAALEMCQVAMGKADLFYLRSVDNAHALRIVDIAASTLILREAGGEVFDMTGNLLDMNFDINDRKSLIAVGDKSLRRLAL